MFELIFGLIWELVAIPFMIIFVGNSDDTPIFVVAIISIFVVVGIVMIIKGIVEIVKNMRTSKLGEEAYGRVINIKGNGQYINDSPVLVAEVKVYVKSLNQVIDCSEEVGTGIPKYDIGEYVKVKYYKGDINFLEKVNVDALPLDIKNYIYEEVKPTVESSSEVHQGPIVYYESQDIVNVDGVRYKKIS